MIWVGGPDDGQFLSETAGGATTADAQALLKQTVYKVQIRKQDLRSEWTIPLGNRSHPGKKRGV